MRKFLKLMMYLIMLGSALAAQTSMWFWLSYYGDCGDYGDCYESYAGLILISSLVVGLAITVFAAFRWETRRAIGVTIFLLLFCTIFALGWTYPIIPLWTARNEARLVRLRSALPEARRQWEAQAISDYVLEVGVFYPLARLCDMTLVVQDGQLVSEDMGQGHIAGEDSVSAHMTCNHEDYIVPQVFDRVGTAINELDPSEWELEVQFDPQFGYVTDYYQSRGHWVSDGFMRITVYDFSVSEP